jgi:glycosyltransferase involved in cell wall biosynthesis
LKRALANPSEDVKRASGTGREAVLSLVVPVLNEAEAVSIFPVRVGQVFPRSSPVRLEVVFVNDGSIDDTLARVLEMRQTFPHPMRVINLSGNFGKEAALFAGLHFATGDIVVPIEADLQDPCEIIPDMIEKWREGYEVVLVRPSSTAGNSGISLLKD